MNTKERFFMVTSTEKLMQIVDDAKNEMKKAESAFADSANKIQDMASSSIGLDQMNYAAKIIVEARRMVTELYSSYEALVRIVDERAKILLMDNPSATAVKAVVELLTKINKESSNISVDFTASLNYDNLGDVGTIKSTASVEAIVIQKFWEDYYRNMPEVIAAKEEKKRVESQYAEARKAEKNKLDSAKRDLYDSIKEKNRHKEAVFKTGMELVDQYKKELQTRLNVRISEDQTENEAKITALASELSQQKQLVSSLGFFKFSEKKTAKNKISELQQAIEHLQSPQERTARVEKLRHMGNAALADYQKLVNVYLERRFCNKTIIIEKMADVATKISEPNAGLERDLYYTLKEHAPATIGDVQQILEKLYGDYRTFSFAEISTAAHSLVKKGVIVRFEVEGSARFCLSGQKYKEEVEVWEENSIVAKESFPQPKAASTIF